MWFKFNDDFFESPKIKLIKAMDKGLETIHIYMNLVAMASKQGNDGIVSLDSQPYTNDMLSILLGFSVDIINQSLDALEIFGLISKEEYGLLINNFDQFQDLKKTKDEKMQAHRESQKKYREKNKNEKSPSDITNNHKKITDDITEKSPNITNDITVIESDSLDKNRIDIDKNRIDKNREDVICSEVEKRIASHNTSHINFDKVKNIFENTYGLLSTSTCYDINMYLEQGLEAELIIHSIERARRVNKNYASYALGICKNWLNESVFTMQQFNEKEGLNNNGNNNRSNGNNYRTTEKHDESEADKQRNEFARIGAMLKDDELQCKY